MFFQQFMLIMQAIYAEPALSTINIWILTGAYSFHLYVRSKGHYSGVQIVSMTQPNKYRYTRLAQIDTN